MEVNIREIYAICKSVADRWWNGIVSYFHFNRIFLLFALVVILCSFSYELFNQTLSIDDELWIWAAVPNHDWIRQGRWGMFLVNCIFVNPCIPFFSLFTTLLFHAVAFLVIVGGLAEQTRCRFLLFPLFATASIFYFAYTFNSLLPGLGIAIFCAAVAVRLAYASSPRWYLLLPAMVLGAFSIGCYQALLNLLLFLCIFFLIRDLIILPKNWSAILRQCLHFLLFGIGVLGIYYAGNKVAMILSGNTDQLYLAQYSVQFPVFQNPGSFFRFVWRSYYGANKIYGVDLFLQGGLFVGCVVIVACRILFLRTSWWRKGMALVGSALLVLAPFFLTLILNFRELRGLFCLGWAISLLFLLAWRFSASPLRVLLAGVAVLCIFQYLWFNNKLAYSNKLSWERDKTLAIRILTRIDELPIHNLVPHDTPLMIVGEPDVQGFAQETPFHRVGTIGRSIFNHDGGVTGRIEKLFSLCGNNLFRQAGKAERQNVIERAVALPHFPEPGSVALIDGVVVVVFSTPTARQIRDLQFERRILSQTPKMVREYRGSLEGWRTVFRMNDKNSDLSHPGIAAETNESGEIKLHISGEDTWFLLSGIPAGISQEYLVEFDIEASNDDEFHIYFKNAKDDSYSEARSVKLKLNKGENRFYLRFPGRLLRFPLRLDPGNGAAENITIKKIAVLEQ